MGYEEYRFKSLQDERNYFADRLKLGEPDHEYCLEALRSVIERINSFEGRLL